jgi:membrane-bound lytic murein transglycosylase D
MKKRILALALAASFSVVAFARPTVLSIKESIQDSTIVYPESFETDTQELMKNWYLQNYAVLSGDGETKDDVPTSDEDYLQRLKALPTVIEMPYNQVVRSYIDMYTQRRRTLVEEMLGLSLYYMPIFEQALEQEGLPLELKYLPVIESALNPDAVSRVGATGLWQFMLSTAKGLGLEVNSLVDERRDPIRSSELAAKYLKQLYEIYGDWSLAIASYNCGPGNVNKALRRAGGGKQDFWDIYYYLPKETRGYVPAFIAANYVMTYHNDHNIGNALAKRPVLTDTIHITQRVHFDQISEVLGIPVEELRVLNPQYRRDEIPGDIRPYALTLPSKQVYSYIVSEDSIVNHNSAKYARRTTAVPGGEISDSETQLVVKYHKVKRGETLSIIARRYGVSVSTLKKWNGLRSSRLKTGQRLRINTYQRVAKKEEPETVQEELAENKVEQPVEKPNTTVQQSVDVDTKYHTVRRGETLGLIAERYGVTVSRLKDWNDLRSNKIFVGQRLKVVSMVDKGEIEVEGDADVQENATTHKVRRGESLFSIAEDYGVTIDNLKEWNNLSGSSIDAGQTLIVNASAAKASKKSSGSSEKKAATTKHKVRRGETLGAIASRYGVTVDNLKDWNNLSSSRIDVGQTLIVKGNKSTSSLRSSKSSYTTHTVRNGETLGGIAERYGTTASAIRKANGIKGSMIRKGQKLKIPKK